MYTKYNILLLCTVRSVCHKHKYTSFVRETRENCEKQPAVFVHTQRTISTRARMERFVDPITLSVLFIIESSMNSFRKQDVFFHSALCRTLNCVVNRTLLQSYINFCVSSRKMVLLRNSVNFLFWSTSTRIVMYVFCWNLMRDFFGFLINSLLFLFLKIRFVFCLLSTSPYTLSLFKYFAQHPFFLTETEFNRIFAVIAKTFLVFNLFLYSRNARAYIIKSSCKWDKWARAKQRQANVKHSRKHYY